MEVHAQTTRSPLGQSRAKLSLVMAFVALLAGVLATVFQQDGQEGTQEAAPLGGVEAVPAARLHLPARGGMVRIPAGRFRSGPGGSFVDGGSGIQRRHIEVRSFWIDETPVTNAAFARFVDATGYTTTAEARGRSLVFDTAARQWLTVEGASWRRPEGPASSIAGQEDWPVVQVSWYDARAYARWAKRRLPTAAEYEYAARGGLADCEYPWGRELFARGRHHANAWQGRFPDFDQGRDGYLGRSPVRAFPANRYGLFDMLGNVYCWCGDSYDPDDGTRGGPREPAGSAPAAQRVQRGGAWLSAANHEPLALERGRAADPAESTNHVGFRCASDLPPDAAEEVELARRATGPVE